MDLNEAVKYYFLAKKKKQSKLLKIKNQKGKTDVCFPF